MAYLATFALLAVAALFPELGQDAGQAYGASREA